MILDVLSLGRDTAINLGVSYDRLVKLMLVLSAILISVSMALVGPITFFGFIVANLSYQFFKSYKHSVRIVGASDYEYHRTRRGPMGRGGVFHVLDYVKRHHQFHRRCVLHLFTIKESRST